jgi:hypothetical protein
MKGLDTPALLAVLEGSPPAKELLRRLRGTELATSEVNLLELTMLAAAAPRKWRANRLASVARLRQRVTVLPVDTRAIEEVRKRTGSDLLSAPPHVLAMLGALEAGGCEELFTDDPSRIPLEWRFRVSRISGDKSRKRETRNHA